jgi:hypothetical protein
LTLKIPGLTAPIDVVKIRRSDDVNALLSHSRAIHRLEKEMRLRIWFYPFLPGDVRRVRLGVDGVLLARGLKEPRVRENIRLLFAVILEPTRTPACGGGGEAEADVRKDDEAFRKADEELHARMRAHWEAMSARAARGIGREEVR